MRQPPPPLSPCERNIRIYDCVDSEVAVLRRMYSKRLRVYADMGYSTTDQLTVPSTRCLSANLA
jgi:hypothetical protein